MDALGTVAFACGVDDAVSDAFASGGEINPLGTLAFDARLEGERYFIEFGVGFLIPAVVNSSATSYGGLTAGLGASYSFPTELSGAVGIGW